MTSGAKPEGRFGEQDFAYLAVYRCPAGEKLRRYWTTACPRCPLKSRCTTGPGRRITRWEHEQVLEAVQQRLDENPQAMRVRRETVEPSLRYAQDAYGCDALSDEAPAEGCHREALHVLAFN